MEAMQPEFEDETPINPFDFWQGANFKLKIVKKDGYWNYDKSEFGSVESLLDDDDALEAIWKKCYSLTAVTAPDQFKTYEELERRLNMVLGKKTPPTQSQSVVAQEEEYESYVESYNSSKNVEKELEESYNRSKNVPEDLSRQLASLGSSTSSADEEDEDDALSYFQRLAES